MTIKFDNLSYKRTPIRFRAETEGFRENWIYVNATDMARFERVNKHKLEQWLRHPYTQACIEKLQELYNDSPSDYFVYVDEDGTWLTSELAILFAKSFGYKLYDWCREHIKECLNSIKDKKNNE